MIGGREQLDIAPAVALGMRAGLVAIEAPPAASAADAVVTSLRRAVRTLEGWAR